MEIKAVEGTIPAYLPGSRFPIKAEIRSDIEKGITITIPPGAQMFGLHNLIIEGDLLEVMFKYKESKPDKETN